MAARGGGGGAGAAAAAAGVSAARIKRKGARPELTEDQKQEIKEAFDLFDSEKTGYLDYHELKVRCAGGDEWL